MTEKSRVNKNALWPDRIVDQDIEQPVSAKVKRTTNNKSVKAQLAKAEAKPDTVMNQQQRLIVILYKTVTGEIMVSQELLFDSEGNGNIAWSGIAMDMTIKIFNLMGELAEIEAIQIQYNYKVSAAGTLELKQW